MYEFTDTGPELDVEFLGGEYGLENESPFSEAEEMELAAELLEITSEAELDYFLGKLLKRAWRGVKKVGSAIARPLGGVLKTIAKKALPFVGGALGSFIPIPGVGTALGTALGSAASRLFEVNLEGLSEEDQEFEMARRFVRFAGVAARNAAVTGSADPMTTVKSAVATAAQQHAPGLIRRSPGAYPQSGRWVRRGGKIILGGAGS